MASLWPGRRGRRELDASWLALRGEELARRALKQRGYRILASRERSRLGEIDIVARDDSALVFVEVKTRRGGRFGKPVEAVDRRKQRRLVRLALAYTARRGLSDTPIRFDIVGVELPTEGRPSVHVYRNAFGEDG
ncbi:MAG TPA: YraN family protein [Vicinamibacteria bacterium]